MVQMALVVWGGQGVQGACMMAAREERGATVEGPHLVQE